MYRIHQWAAALLIGLTFVTGIGQAQSARPAPASQRLRILVLQGPNTNLFGVREPSVYGRVTYTEINEQIEKTAAELGVEVIILQSNHEGVLVDAFQQHQDDVDGALINAAGLSFSSVALVDVIKAMRYPVIEVHMSNLATRDEVHRHSILSTATQGTVMGLGWRSYTAALRALVESVRDEHEHPNASTR